MSLPVWLTRQEIQAAIEGIRHAPDHNINEKSGVIAKLESALDQEPPLIRESGPLTRSDIESLLWLCVGSVGGGAARLEIDHAYALRDKLRAILDQEPSEPCEERLAVAFDNGYRAAMRDQETDEPMGDKLWIWDPRDKGGPRWVEAATIARRWLAEHGIESDKIKTYGRDGQLWWVPDADPKEGK